MPEWLTNIESFAEGLGPIERLALSAVFVVAAIAVTWIAPWVRSLLEDRVRPSTADLLTSLAVAASVAAASAAVLAVWGQLARVGEAIAIASPTDTVIPELILSISILVATYVMTSFLRRMIDDVLAEHDAVSDHQREVVYRTSQLSLYIVAILVVLGLWQVDLSGLLIGAGFLGIIVGFAARETLSAVFAGFVLMFSRPFEIGDWIAVVAQGESVDDATEGIVTDITIVNTRIQTFDGEYVMIPNDVVSSSEIHNRTRKGRLRIEIEVGIDYTTDVDAAAEMARSAMRGSERTLSVPAPDVVVKGFGDSAVVLGLRFWIDNPSSRRRWRARTAVAKRVKRAFEREGIKIPFPQRELTGRAETGGFRLAGEEPIAEERGGGTEGHGERPPSPEGER